MATKERYMRVMGAYTLDMHNGGTIVRRTVAIVPGADYGSDPIGDGMFRMVPSGDVVDAAERDRRLNR